MDDSSATDLRASQRDTSPRTDTPTIELASALLLFVVVSAVSYLWQRPVTVADGQGWDGVHYFSIAEQLARHLRPAAEAPFVFRLGTPWLAATFFGHDLLTGFWIVNAIGSLLGVVLLVFWLRLQLRQRATRILLVTLYTAMWYAPVRFTYFYPVRPDPWLFVALLAALLAAHHARRHPSLARVGLFAGVTFLGAIVREVAIVVPIAFLFAANPIQDWLRSRKPGHGWRLAAATISSRKVVPLAASVLGLLVVRGLVTQTGDYSFWLEALRWVYEKPAVTYLHAWFVAFGPIVIMPILNWRGTVRLLQDDEPLAVYLGMFAVLAWIGGSDTEKILQWGLPAVFVLVGRSLEDQPAWSRSRLFQGTLLFGQSISERIYWATPDYSSAASARIPVLTIPSSAGRYFDLFSFHGSRRVEALSLLEYLVLSAVLVWWWRRLQPPAARAGGVTASVKNL